MIRLSREQMLALDDLELHRFIGRVVDELPGYRGPLVAGRSRDTLFRAALETVQRARHYGLDSEKALFLYVNLAVTLGVAFDSDPGLPWAQEILGGDGYLGNEKMDDLWNTYLDWCEAVMGHEQDYTSVDACRAWLERPTVPVFDGTSAPVVADLAALWPAKARFMGPQAAQAHVIASGRRAAGLGLRLYGSRVRFCRMAFLLGHAFDGDPLHDWTWPILRLLVNETEGQVMDRLEAAFEKVFVAPILAEADQEDDA